MPTIITSKQLRNEEFQELIALLSTNLQLRKLRLDDSEDTIFCDMSIKKVLYLLLCLSGTWGSSSVGEQQNNALTQING